MEQYDLGHIGALIAWGGDHFVYRYGTDSVLKLSKIEFVLGRIGRNKAYRDYEICRRYFGDAVLETTFLKAPGSERVGKLQPFLSGRSVTREDLHNPRVRAQFEVFLDAYRQMQKDGYAPVDLIGGHGIWSRTLANIFLAEDTKLYLIDTTLIEVDVPVIRIIARVVRTLAMMRQEATIAYLLKG